MNEQEKKEYDRKKDFHFRCCKQDGIIDNITYRSDNYPEKFYLILEKIDLLMRSYISDEVCHNFDELISLCSIIGLNGHLKQLMPPSGRAFFEVMINPKKSYEIFRNARVIYGDISRSYADLRQYLIDNAEKVTECYIKYYDLRDKISGYGEYKND